MSYTVSFDASIKIKQGDFRGYLNHLARDIDKKNGIFLNHSNPNINPENTFQNETFFYDQERGGFRKCTDKKQIEKSLEKRLDIVRKNLESQNRKMRKDAVIIRPLILQLDPKWYEEKNPNEREKQKARLKMIAWARDTFGIENIVGFSIHKDEASEHIHLAFTPVTEDGRLSQKDWFSNPRELRKMHSGLRTHMRGAGYDIELSNKKSKRHVKRMTESEYREYANFEQQVQEIKERQEQLDRNQEAQERVYKARRKALDEEYEEKVKEAEEAKLEANKAKLEADEARAKYDEMSRRLGAASKLSENIERRREPKGFDFGL